MVSEIEWLRKKAKKSKNGHPDLKGWMTVNANGQLLASSDKKSSQLADILPQFNKLTEQIGEAFGQKTIEEIHIVCEDLTAICSPGKQETFAAIFDKETRPSDFLAKYQPK